MLRCNTEKGEGRELGARNTKFYLKGHKEVIKELERMKKAPEKVLAALTNDVKDRAPAWIAQGVVERYNLEGSKAKGKKAITSGKAGMVKTTGSLVNGDMQLEYSGRTLTPVHFGMKPTTMPTPGSQYTLKWKVLNKDGNPMVSRVKKLTKKQRKNIGRNFTRQSTRTSMRSPWMLQYTGNTREGGVDYIPFQRTENTGRKMQQVKRPVALPQMVTEGKDGPMHNEVAEVFHEKLEKRYEHYLNRYMK